MCVCVISDSHLYLDMHIHVQTQAQGHSLETCLVSVGGGDRTCFGIRDRWKLVRARPDKGVVGSVHLAAKALGFFSDGSSGLSEVVGS